MLELAKAVHNAIGTESRLWFLVTPIMFFFLGFIVDQGYQREKKEQERSHNLDKQSVESERRPEFLRPSPVPHHAAKPVSPSALNHIIALEHN
jgi:hypothetical protein